MSSWVNRPIWIKLSKNLYWPFSKIHKIAWPSKRLPPTASIRFSTTTTTLEKVNEKNHHSRSLYDISRFSSKTAQQSSIRRGSAPSQSRPKATDRLVDNEHTTSKFIELPIIAIVQLRGNQVRWWFRGTNRVFIATCFGLQTSYRAFASLGGSDDLWLGSFIWWHYCSSCHHDFCIRHIG